MSLSLKSIENPAFQKLAAAFASFQLPLETTVDWIDILNKDTKTRCIKSHLPVELLPRQIWTKKPKVVYVARNPKDVVLSYFHHHRSWTVYSGSFETFADAFLDDVALYGPYWKHVLDFWNLKEPYVLFNTYEEMKADLAGVIRKTAKFLGKTLTEAQISELEEHLSFKKMKENS
ncbi:Sulfotransferase family cytosolic 1B member 1, partial [Gryllus bimaculatus]